MSTSTLRLTDELQADASRYAERLGISLNALCAVALRDYLDARVPLAPLHQGAAVPTVTRLSGTKAASALDALSLPPGRSQLATSVTPRVKVGANDPCPCGSGEKFKRCHGKPGT